MLLIRETGPIFRRIVGHLLGELTFGFDPEFLVAAIRLTGRFP